MNLTAKQEEGLKIAVERFKNHEPYTCISGYAGTGKSTLIKFIIAALDIPPEEVSYVAYTGKAAQVLKQKGCPNPVTAHIPLAPVFVIHLHKRRLFAKSTNGNKSVSPYTDFPIA